MAEYGFDLVQEWETVGARRLWVLIQGLPPDAAVWREEWTERQAWTQQDELLAGQIEMTDIASRRVVIALGGKFSPSDKPLQIDRPTPKEKPRLITDSAEIATWFGSYKGT